MPTRNFIPLFASLALTLLLTACGGGGGDSTPTPTPNVTVNCPNGTTQTASTQASAEALCAAPKLLTMTPADKVASVSPDTFAGVIVPTDSLLAVSSVTAANIKLAMGTTDVAGSLVIDGNQKGFTFTPAVKLHYGQGYTFTASVRDTLGKSLSVASSFTTASITCTAPKVPDSTGNSCIDPVVTFTWPTSVKTIVEAGMVNGVLVNPSNVIRTWTATNPVTEKVGDANWNANLVNGNIQIIKTNEMAPDVTGTQRPIWRAVYTDYANNSCIKPIYADTGEAYGHPGVTGGCFTGTAPQYVVGFNDTTDIVKGGVIYKGTNGFCSKFTTVRGDEPTACPL